MKLKGILIAALSSILFGSSGLIQKPLYDNHVYPLNVLTIAYLVGSTSLATYIFFFKGKEYFSLPKGSFKNVLIQSIFGNVAVTICYSYSVKYLDVSIATMLLYTYPVLIALYSIFILKENVSKVKILSILGTVIGSMLVLNIFNSSESSISKIGLLIGFLTAILYAFLNLYGNKLLKYNIPPITIVFYNNLITFITILIINHKILFNLSDITPKIAGSAAMLSICCQILPMSLLYLALKLVGPVLCSIVTTVEIPAAAILSYIVLGETLSPIQIVGILIVIACIILIKLEKPKIETEITEA